MSLRYSIYPIPYIRITRLHIGLHISHRTDTSLSVRQRFTDPVTNWRSEGRDHDGKVYGFTRKDKRFSNDLQYRNNINGVKRNP